MSSAHGQHRRIRPYLTFQLGDCKYACEVLRVQEIIRQPDLEPGLGGPDLLVGIFASSRGSVPVLDLLARPPDECRIQEMALVVFGADEQSLGLLVDDLHSIIEIDPSEALPIPPNTKAASEGQLQGVVELEGTDYYLLDLDRIFSAYLGAAAGLPPQDANEDGP